MVNKPDIVQEDMDPLDGSLHDYIQKIDYWKSVGRASENTGVADKRFTIDPERTFYYEYKPLHVMLPLITIGVPLFVLQWLMPYGLLVSGVNDYTGYLRLMMMIVGAYCIFLAWPRWRDSRMSDAEEEGVEELRERMWRKKFP